MSFKLKKDGKIVAEFSETIIHRSRLLSKLLEEVNTDETELLPNKSKDFSAAAVIKCKDFLEKFPDGLPKLPKKPIMIFVALNGWFDHNFQQNDRQWSEEFLKPKNYYDLVEIFNAALYLQIDDLREVVAAKIAHSIILERKAPEDFLKEFGIGDEY